MMVSALEIEVVFCGSDTSFVHIRELSVADVGSSSILKVLDLDVALIMVAVLETEIVFWV